jgi:hypothetical protein
MESLEVVGSELGDSSVGVPGILRGAVVKTENKWTHSARDALRVDLEFACAIARSGVVPYPALSRRYDE